MSNEIEHTTQHATSLDDAYKQVGFASFDEFKAVADGKWHDNGRGRMIRIVPTPTSDNIQQQALAKVLPLQIHQHVKSA